MLGVSSVFSPIIISLMEAPILDPPLKVAPDSTINLLVAMSPLIWAVAFKVSISDTSMFPITCPSISAFWAMMLPSTCEECPMISLDLVLILPMIFPSILILPNVSRSPLRVVPFPMIFLALLNSSFCFWSCCHKATNVF